MRDGVYSMKYDQQKARGLSNLIEALREVLEPEFVVSCEHPYDCRCDSCRQWWRDMGPDPETDAYGPFTKEEIEEE